MHGETREGCSPPARRGWRPTGRARRRSARKIPGQGKVLQGERQCKAQARSKAEGKVRGMGENKQSQRTGQMCFDLARHDKQPNHRCITTPSWLLSLPQQRIGATENSSCFTHQASSTCPRLDMAHTVSRLLLSGAAEQEAECTAKDMPTAHPQSSRTAAGRR